MTGQMFPAMDKGQRSLHAIHKVQDIPSGWIEGEEYEKLTDWDHIPEHIRITGRLTRKQVGTEVSKPDQLIRENRALIEQAIRERWTVQAIASRLGTSARTVRLIKKRVRRG
jgi:hypothetical protein